MKTITRENLEALAKIQCNQAEFRAFFSCHGDTLDNRIEEYYGMTFKEFLDTYGGQGKISLRRRMFRKAIQEGDTKMMIHLSKNHLDMSDKTEVKGILGHVNTNPTTTEEAARAYQDLIKGS